jgi:hypothetical protein
MNRGERIKRRRAEKRRREAFATRPQETKTIILEQPRTEETLTKEPNKLTTAPPAAPADLQAQQTEAIVAPTSSDAPVPSAPLRRAIYRWFHGIWKVVEVSALLFSFFGVVYLAYDTYYRTGLSIDFAYSDAATATNNPIVLTNNSNIFTVKHIVWTCFIYSMNNLNEGRGYRILALFLLEILMKYCPAKVRIFHAIAPVRAQRSPLPNG